MNGKSYNNAGQSGASAQRDQASYRDRMTDAADIIQGRDGKYAVCFKNNLNFGEHDIRVMFSQFGDVHSILCSGVRTFVRYYEEGNARRAINDEKLHSHLGDRVVPARPNCKEYSRNQESQQKQLGSNYQTVQNNNVGLLPIPLAPQEQRPYASTLPQNKSGAPNRNYNARPHVRFAPNSQGPSKKFNNPVTPRSYQAGPPQDRSNLQRNPQQLEMSSVENRNRTDTQAENMPNPVMPTPDVDICEKTLGQLALEMKEAASCSLVSPTNHGMLSSNMGLQDATGTQKPIVLPLGLFTTQPPPFVPRQQTQQAIMTHANDIPQQGKGNHANLQGGILDEIIISRYPSNLDESDLWKMFGKEGIQQIIMYNRNGNSYCKVVVTTEKARKELLALNMFEVFGHRLISQRIEDLLYIGVLKLSGDLQIEESLGAAQNRQ